MVTIKDLLTYLTNLISGTFPFALLMLCGIYLTLKSGFFQIRAFNKSVTLVKKAFSSPKSQEGINSYQAACTALSSTVGTGNIAGVASAISIGGAGAVFWMLISALFGMCIKGIEIILAIKYRECEKTGYIGGPMYYIKNGLPKLFKPLSYIFSLAALPAVLCSGNITQTNAAVSSLNLNFTGKLIFGIIFTALTFCVLIGGIKRIGLITEKIIPIMSVLYVILSLSIIILNIDFLPQAFKMIIVGAFKPEAVTGGAVGSAMTVMMTGASRGIFSNEAGLGTSAMAHSVAVDADPKTQGLYGLFEVFIDTILLCTLTALTILCSRVNINYGFNASSELVVDSLSAIYGNLSTPIIAAMLCLFSFSSIIGWAVYGKISTRFLFGAKGEGIFTFIYPFACIFGAVTSSSFAWDLSAFFNGIMLIINLPVLILLSKVAIKYMKGNKNAKKTN